MKVIEFDKKEMLLPMSSYGVFEHLRKSEEPEVLNMASAWIMSAIEA